MRAISPRSASLPALAAATALLAACASQIRHQVVTPPPSAPRMEFALEAAEVQSRAVGDEAWRRNQELASLLTLALEEALRAAGKTVVTQPGAHIVRSRVYLAFGTAPVKSQTRKPAPEYVEVRLELLDPESKQVRYSTHTKTKLQDGLLAEWVSGSDADTAIEETLRKAAQDFASRL